MSKSSVLLLGASGLVGGECLNLLLQKDTFDPVVVLNRRKLEAARHPRVIEFITAFENIAELSDLIRAESVICALGTTIKKAGSQSSFRKVDYDIPVEIGKIAMKNGTRNFILVSALGANPDSKIFYNRIKGEVETAIRQLGFESAVFLRPSLLLGNRKEQRTGEKLARQLGHWFSFLLPGKYKPVEARTVSAAAIYFAENPERGVRIVESNDIRKIGKDYLSRAVEKS